jgi:hypothetical protein
LSDHPAGARGLEPEKAEGQAEQVVVSYSRAKRIF